jgi:hypothetical protein
VASVEEILQRPLRNDLFHVLAKSGAQVEELRLTAGRIQSGDTVTINHHASNSFLLFYIALGTGCYLMFKAI